MSNRIPSSTCAARCLYQESITYLRRGSHGSAKPVRPTNRRAYSTELRRLYVLIQFDIPVIVLADVIVSSRRRCPLFSLLRMSRPLRTTISSRNLIACVGSPGPRRDETASARRGSYAARFSESTLTRFPHERACKRHHDSPIAIESGTGLSGRASAERGCSSQHASRAARWASSGVRRRAAVWTSSGATAGADQGCVVRNTSRHFARHGAARRRAAQLRNLDVCGRVLRGRDERRGERARGSFIAVGEPR